MLTVIKDNRVHFFAFFVMSCCTSSASNDRLSALACEQREHGGVPCAGGACPAPGGTPTFLSLSPLAALKRRAKLTGRLPHGKLCKPVDHCYGISHIWEEALPWTDSRSKRTEPQYDWRNIGEPHWRSEFRSLNRCGFLRTKRACECGDWSVDNCRRCESPSCVEKLSIGCADSCCGATDCPQDCCAECNACGGKDECKCCSDCDSEHCRCCRYECDTLSSPKAPYTRAEQQEQAWNVKRTAFRSTRARAANPSGNVNPVGERMKATTRSLSFKGATQRSVGRNKSRFVRASASRHFVGSGDPDAFCNSLRCRFAANGPVEQRAAICQFGPQSR